MRVVGFSPVVDARARVLVLGSMPGVRSLDADQYYAHARNAFWPIMAAIYGLDARAAYAERLAALQAAGVALWDVVERCDRPGSLDAAIVAQSVVVNDIGGLLAHYPSIDLLAFNGAAAAHLFARHVRRGLPVASNVQCVALPSTSPAHAAMTLATKQAAWSKALGAVRNGPGVLQVSSGLAAQR